MAINVGSLLVSLGLDSAEFKTGLSNAEKEFKRSTKRIEATGRSMSDFGKKMSLAVTAPLVALGVTSIKAATESNQALASVKTTLASMGAQAGLTAKQLEDAAGGIMAKSLYDDDEILQKVTNTLLTFGKVAGSTFLRAQQAAVDLSAKFGKDLQSSTLMVGKALQDPTKGLTALTRAGITFSPAQQEVIKSLVKTGQVAKAQELILKELEAQVSGSAKTMRDADPMAALRLSFGEFQEEIGKKLLPLFPQLVGALTSVLDAFGKLSPGMQQAVLIGAGLAAAFGPLITIFGSIVGAMAPFITGVGLATKVAEEAGVSVGRMSLSLNVLRAGLITAAATLGPWLIGLAALAGVYYIVKSRSDEVSSATGKYAKAQEEANAKSEKARQVLAQMATANAKLRAEIIARAKADRQAAIQAREKAKADLLALKAETARLKTFRDAGARSLGATDPRFASLMPSAGAQKAINQNVKNQKALEDSIKSNTAEIESLTAAINAGATPPPVADIKPETGSGGADRRNTPTGPTAAEIEAQFADETRRLEMEALSARERLATNLDDRVDLQYQMLSMEREQRIAEIDSNKDFSAKQKAALKAQIDALYGTASAMDDQGQILVNQNEGLIAQQLRRDHLYEIERQAQDAAQDEYDRQRDLLGFQANLADTQAERKRIALEILALEQAYRRQQLEMIAASKTATDAEKQRAQSILDGLSVIEAGERASANRANETEVERYLRDLNKSPEQINEAIDGIKISGLENLNDALVDAIVNFKSLADVAKSVVQSVIADLLRLSIQQAIIKPLANALGLGAGLAGARAMGGPVQIGQSYLVGEHGPEIFRAGQTGTIIPNHDLAAMASNDRGGAYVDMKVFTPDANSFHRSERMIATSLRRRIG